MWSCYVMHFVWWVSNTCKQRYLLCVFGHAKLIGKKQYFLVFICFIEEAFLRFHSMCTCCIALGFI